ncbi:hypothetical protein PRIPAC_80780 [Pristionchus pacificus]|uniref:Uncharacterized protein n=1 Tax=Pristionchus pacificus TaxID=54126 RepID=A0A2A6CP05_PRIPA|nr:hypothetical protein PRIPAC_80780 [Pristionchus pacificus]|eukprot:PDM79850.1 hypothetical protein PRIPAC_32429 [Pristionchus pacificus]
MRIILCILYLLVALTVGAPTDLIVSDRQKIIVDIWGPEVNLISANIILEQESGKLKISLTKLG